MKPMSFTTVMVMAAAVLTCCSAISLSGCSKRETMSKSEAEVIMVDARRLEQQHKLHQAYYKYKQVETTYEETDIRRAVISSWGMRIDAKNVDLSAAWLSRWRSRRGSAG
jgi:hypothetical protein